MAENILPSAAQTAGSTADQPGRPYYESLRETLRQNLEKKRKLDEQLATLEDQMFRMEGNYLEETAMSGNIVRGFDGWVKGVVVGGRSAADDRRRGRIREEDRVFSRSSVNWMRIQEGQDSATTSHAATPTASHAPPLSARENSASTPTAGGTKTGANKKKRATEKEEEDDSKGVKRSKITYARDS